MKRQAPDHIAVTGDIANIGLAEEYRHGRDLLESLGTAHDVSFVPGNHDIYVPEAAAVRRAPVGSLYARRRRHERLSLSCAGAGRWR